MKKFLVALLSAIILVTGVAFITACDSCGSDGGAKEVLKTYILPQTAAPVEDDFTLDRKVNGEIVEWKSNNAAIAIEEKDDDFYLAKVTMGNARQEVTLTVTHGEEVKDFDVIVMALDVDYLSGKYVFKQKGLNVFNSFNLDTKFTYKGAEATITWTVEDGADYISVNEAGNKCIVNGTSLNPTVKLKAVFAYNNETTEVIYRFYASESITHEEIVDSWFNGKTISEISGYVVEIAIAKTDDGKIGVYVIDDDFCSGYYLYYIPIDDADYANLKVGAHVTATGFTCSPYNGLPETKSGSGKLVVDTDKEALTEAQLAEKIYAIDNDLLTGVSAAKYHTSTLVSLDKWTVDEVKTSIDLGSGTQTLFVLEKGGVKVNVVVGKYISGAYTYAATDATYSALAALLNTVKKGDVISITKAILSYSNAYQVIPYNADCIVKETVTATPVSESATKVKAAIAAVNAVLNGNVITQNGTLTIPATDGVTTKVELLKETENVTLADNVITVTVGEKEVKVPVKVTYTAGDYTTYVLYSVHVKNTSNDDIVADAKDKLELPTVVLSNFVLKTTVADNSSEIAWSIKTAVAGVSIADGKLVNATNEDKQVTLVATITFGGASTTKEIPVTVKGTLAVADITAGEVNLALYQANKGQVLYLTGEMNGYYYATTADATKAAAIEVAAVDGGYTFKVVTTGVTATGKYLEITTDGSHTNVVFSDAASNGKWVYNSELGVFTWTLGEKVYYLGTFGTNVTMSASETYRISDNNASVVGVSQFPAYFVKPTSTPAASGALTLTKASIGVIDTSANDKSYAAYNGDHTVDGYTVSTTDVMASTYGGRDVIQVKKTSGVLTLSGEFTKIRVVVLSTYAYDKMNKVPFYAGETELTATCTGTENTGVKSGNYDILAHTMEYTVTGTGVQEIKIADTLGAVYFCSIEFIA